MKNTGYIIQQLLNRKTAVVSTSYVLLVLIVALFAPQIATDNTPNADWQMVEIQAKPPGYKQQFITVHAKEQYGNFFAGYTLPYTAIPITGYTIQSNGISISRYVDDDTCVVEWIPTQQLVHHKKPLNNIIEKKYLLGTDTFGRDIMSRLFFGARISLAVGFVAVFISLLIGVILGATGGYFGGKTDKIIVWFINITWSIPTILLVFAITLLSGKGLLQIFTAVGLTMWVPVARLVRGQILYVKELDYITAARALGYSDVRIIIHHILPNISGALIVVAASNFASAILIEAGLSFLGIGVQTPTPSWGLMIRENYTFIITHQPLLAIIPGVAIMLLVLAVNLIGNALRDILDVRNK